MLSVNAKLQLNEDTIIYHRTPQLTYIFIAQGTLPYTRP